MKHLFLFAALLLALTTTAQTPEADMRTANNAIKTIKLLSLPGGSLSGINDKMMNAIVKRTPYLTLTELRAGKADSARVVFLRTTGTYYYPFAYVRDTTALTTDKDGQSDDGVKKIIVGKKIFESLENSYTPEMWGAVGIDGISDSLAFRAMETYINSRPGPATIRLSTKTYYKAYFDIKKKGVWIIGDGSSVSYGEFKVHGTSAGQELNFGISGITFTRSAAITAAENSTVNNAIEIWNAGIGTVTNCVMENYNAGIYFRPTGVFQSTRRMVIDQVYTKYGNYGIKVPETDAGLVASIPGGAGSKRVVGDIKILNSMFQWPYYDQIFLYGVDGLNMTNVATFSRGNDVNFATKRNNFRMFFVTYCTLNDLKAFEAGEDAFYMVRCENVTGNNIHIAWPGQRVVSNGIYINNIQTPNDPELAFSLNNVIIDTPTKNGILIDGTIDTQMYTFTNIMVNKIGESGEFHGNETIAGITYSNPPPSAFEKHSIWVTGKTTGVNYQGLTDTEYWGGSPKNDRGPRLDTKNGVASEYNTRRGKINVVYGRETIKTDKYDKGFPTFSGNMIPQSNNFLSTTWTKAGIKTLVADSTFLHPLGIKKDRVWWARDNGTTNTQKAILLQNYLTADSTRSVIYAFSVFAKYGGRDGICMYLSDGTDWIKQDFDVYGGKVGATLYNSTSSKHNLIGAYSELAENGYRRYTVIDSVAAGGRARIKPHIYLKELMNSPGNNSYAGDDSSGVWIADIQLLESRTPAPPVRTGATAVPKAPIRWIAIDLPVYADNTAAKAAGLVAGDEYRTSLGVRMVVF